MRIIIEKLESGFIVTVEEGPSKKNYAATSNHSLITVIRKIINKQKVEAKSPVIKNKLNDLQ